MNGFITKRALAACVLGALVAAGSGCGPKYQNLVDPCYPERYEAMARQSVHNALTPQVTNGHVLDQTVWNYHFEAGSDKLTPGGMEKLSYIARRRPAPDTMVYLQTAKDLTYDQAAPEKFIEARTTLDNKRMQVVKTYLNAVTAGRGVLFDVVAHDPSEVGMHAGAKAGIIARRDAAVAGSLPSSTGGGGGSSGGSSGGGSGGSGR